MKLYNRYSRLFAASLVALSMAGCMKESDNMLQLVAEGHQGGAKTSVSGANIYWVDGDKVLINGSEYILHTTANTTATVEVTANENADLLAIYPSSLGTVSNSQVNVTLPSVYFYSEADGRQQVAFPMVAKGKMEQGGSLRFKHLSAAIDVVVKNTSGHRLMVRSIVVKSDQSQLCGTRSIAVSDWGTDFAVEPVQTNTAADRMVSFALDEDDCVLDNGASRAFQIPVYPILPGDNLNFTIYSGEKKIEGVLVTALYTYHSGDIAVSGGIARAVVAQTPEIGIAEGAKVTRMDSKFSVAAGQQVYFSQGLLQYSKVNSKWSFAGNQYTGLGAANGESTDIIDLFCYGETNPNAGYSKVDDDVSGTNNDWARHAGITYDGVTTKQVDKWRTLTWDEWKYLLDRTTGITINGTTNVSYVLASINGKRGLLLLPDGFDPTNVSSCLSTPIDSWQSGAMNALNTDGEQPAFPVETISLSDWAVLEAAGCVFMVGNGWLNYSSGSLVHKNPSDGMYWLGTEYDLDKERAYIMFIDIKGVRNDVGRPAIPGQTPIWVKAKTHKTGNNNKLAVRMVRDVTVTD